ncbi:Carnitine O-acetyltransferase mitochondrial [Puccinia graminis f. sp. tritici]|uniref:Carnitine O-acetyltransferase, mitochondrial n=1 Tax=Puccinia graminis f. sp. tritici TaxID=56615 RepID=A0A5B0NZW0_PUCGR|nr:Carnitine O-acetyltransferase mitochondrial [Puccinia graminis f. sp. tritici]KAA1093338.1 Carnitine O-acetyltransferase mitochondrial [Puccinia graminis f. sp. tritici]
MFSLRRTALHSISTGRLLTSNSFQANRSTMASTRSKSTITYQHQDSLPHLPVPELESTAQKYFRSILPLVSPQDPHSPTASDGTPTPAYKHTKACVEDFLKSPLVKELQNRLKKRAHEEGRESWLSEWWNELAYMAYRDPLIPFSSYYIAHKVDHHRRTGPKRAAGLVRAMMEFRHLTETEQLEPEHSRTGPLCMNSYRWLFNSCRYPVKPSDTARKFDPQVNTHLVVIRKGQFFELPAVKPDGTLLSEAELESQFNKVIQLAGPTETPFPVGALTTEHRDIWADMREELCKTDPHNSKSLERIESGIVCVALDDTSPITRDELGFTIWSGGGKNRFFDKQQLIVCENGQSGFNAEHSCMDGTPVSRMNDWILDALANKKIDLGSSFDSNLPAPTPIEFVLSDTTKQNILRSVTKFHNLMSLQTLDVLEYPGYGKRVIKNQFKTSPDAIAQLTFQLGHYKLFGRVPVTYESCQTRKFKLGRTEVIRSCSIEALEWCKAMEDVNADWPTRLEKFKLAAKAHLAYAKEASDGQGVDRHLLGLRLSLKPGEEMPALFQDPIYKESTNWILSTSTLPSEYFNGLGYGAVVPEGFGLAYAVNEESMRFTVTTTTGNGARLKYCLHEAADDIHKMMRSQDGKGVPNAKL